METYKNRWGDREFRKIQVENGLYSIKCFGNCQNKESTDCLVEIHFYYGKENIDYSFMNIIHGQVCFEYSSDPELKWNAIAKPLRENLHQLQSYDLPRDVKKILSSIKSIKE